MRGWFNDSLRHSLASYGVKTVGCGYETDFGFGIKCGNITDSEISLIREMSDNMKLTIDKAIDSIEDETWSGILEVGFCFDTEREVMSEPYYGGVDKIERMHKHDYCNDFNGEFHTHIPSDELWEHYVYEDSEEWMDSIDDFMTKEEYYDILRNTLSLPDMRFNRKIMVLGNDEHDINVFNCGKSIDFMGNECSPIIQLYEIHNGAVYIQDEDKVESKFLAEYPEFRDAWKQLKKMGEEEIGAKHQYHKMMLRKELSDILRVDSFNVGDIE